jgi:hypothetical protein
MADCDLQPWQLRRTETKRAREAGDAFHPFESRSDAVWAQVEIEEGIGKRQRTRFYQTLSHPDFKPAEMKMTSEKRRIRTLRKLPGGVCDICCISCGYCHDLFAEILNFRFGQTW